MPEKLSSVRSPNSKKKGFDKSASTVLNVTFSKPIYNRIVKMQKAKGLPYEQDIIRLGVVELLEAGGF